MAIADDDVVHTQIRMNITNGIGSHDVASARVDVAFHLGYAVEVATVCPEVDDGGERTGSFFEEESRVGKIVPRCTHHDFPGVCRWLAQSVQFVEDGGDFACDVLHGSGRHVVGDCMHVSARKASHDRIRRAAVGARQYELGNRDVETSRMKVAQGMRFRAGRARGDLDYPRDVEIESSDVVCAL